MNIDQLRKRALAAITLHAFCRSCGEVFPYGEIGEIGDDPPIECRCGRSDLFVHTLDENGQPQEYDPEGADDDSEPNPNEMSADSYKRVSGRLEDL